MAEGRRDDQEYRRRVGRGEIKRAARGFKRVESDLENARTRLYRTMRKYADVFTEEELVALGPVSRPTVRKRVLNLDQAASPEPEQTGGDGTGGSGQDAVPEPDGTGSGDQGTTPDEEPQNGTESG